MPPNLKQRLIETGFKAITASRADRWLAPLARGRGAILMFHHVRPWVERDFAPNRLLEITPEFLDRTLALLRETGFDVIALDEVPARLARNGGPPFAALTFDDGYRDNMVHAAPILRRHEAPWTLFVTTDFAEGRGRLWWLELEEAVARLPQISIDIDGRRLDLPSRTPAEKQAAFAAIYWNLRKKPEEELLAVIGDLAARAGVKSEALVRELCLGWDELAALSRSESVTIGAHTLSHPMLAKHPEARARSEIERSREIIESRLGLTVRHFAYPVGNSGSAGPREFALARQAGFETAVTTRPGHLFGEHRDHLLALPRLSVNGLFQTEAALRALLSGVPFLAWNRGRRLNIG